MAVDWQGPVELTLAALSMLREPPGQLSSVFVAPLAG